MKISADGANLATQREQYARIRDTKDTNDTNELSRKAPEEAAKKEPELPVDEYIPSEEAKRMYQAAKTEQMKPETMQATKPEATETVKPEATETVKPETAEATKPEATKQSKPRAEKKTSTTLNTNKVDGEIKRLKKKKARIEQELRSASEDKKPETKERLRKVKMELAKKDSQQYRKSHAVVS